MDFTERVSAHAALGDPRRLRVADHLALGDHTVAELAELTGMSGNLLAHHLDVLETAGLIERRTSEGDHRRRYVSLRWDRLPSGLQAPEWVTGGLLFVCTHNSARSQFAAALWKERTGRAAESAGSHPSAEVHPKAVEVAAEFGIDISAAEPSCYEQLRMRPDLVVSVCDRAREGGAPTGRRHLHWSVPDPVEVGTLGAFRTAFSEIVERVEHLAKALVAPRFDPETEPRIVTT
ncbi:MAG TPA: MarR family transcriptional regulator [Acidimicrobiia bacterium]